MNKITPTLVLVLALGLGAGFTANVSAAEPAPIPGRILVSFEPGLKFSVDKNAGVPHTGLAGLDVVLDRHGAVSLEPLFGGMVEMFDDPATRADLARHYVLQCTAKAGNDAVNADLKALSMVDDSVSDAVFSYAGTAYLPNDIAAQQWHLRNTSLGGRDTRAVGGWAESLGDTNVVVAVLDTGVDWHHPDLGGPHPDKVNGALWTNWIEYEGTPGVDDDGNGLVDDIRGWDFVNVTAGQVWPGEDYGPPDNDPMDFDGHGTLVSGCIAPITDNNLGIAAIAPGCKIMAVRIGWHSSDGNGYSNASYMAQGFTYATVNGADVINLSYGTGYYAPFASAIQAALNAGLVICVSAGNDNDQEAGYLQGLGDDRILTVAASNSGDGKSEFSSFGTWVDITAPGSNIFTTAYSFQSGESTYTSTQGTSFSSPITAGACALIWSAHPEFSSAQVAALIQSSCDNIDDVNPGYEGLLGHGRVNLLKALGDNVQQVPGEFHFMADAMNEAAEGDIIKVLASHPLPGTTMMGKSLQILGAYDANYDTRDPLGNPTVINGDLSGPAMQFFGTVDNTCVVDGFQCQGGGGRTFADIPYPGKYGGGIMLNQTSPTLRNLVITGNAVGSTSSLGLGGGIAMFNSQAVLENVSITGNEAIYGGGVFVYQGSPTFTDVTIDGNILRTDNFSFDPEGGAIHVLDADLTLDNVTCDNHADAIRGGGIYAADLNGTVNLIMNVGSVSGNTAKTNGAGIYAAGGVIELNDVVIRLNTETPTATFMGGGGLYADGSTVILDMVEVDGNSAHSGGGLQFSICPDVQLFGVVATNNTAMLFGGNVYLSSCVGATLENVTIADNSCPAGGAGLYSISTPTTVSNTISAFNDGGTGTANGMHFSGAATLSCNDVYGNTGSNYGGVADPTGSDGNISLDPLFCNPAELDYRVDSNGPCAPDNSGGCGLIGALEASCGNTNAVDDPTVPLAFRVDHNFPNPFNPATSIRFALPVTAHTTVVVYDVKGRLVKTLVDGELAAATHVVQWRGQDDHGRSAAAGIYFYKVISGEHSAVGRMALIK